MSNHYQGKKEKSLSGEKKEKKRKGQPCHTNWKKSRDTQSVGQKNKSPLQLQRVLNTR